jgi:peptidoglycan-N-acetylglucosamine deacetylase
MRRSTGFSPRSRSAGCRRRFFVTGAFARTDPERVRAIAAAGYPIGNHSDTHRSYPALTEQAIRADLAAAEASIVAVTGHTTRPLFRFRFGAHTDADIRIVNDDGYLPVQWTVDSLGWKGTSGGLSARAVTDRVLAAATAGQIVLMHVGANPNDGTTLDADALPGIIDGLRAQGYDFVTLGGIAG